MVKHKDLESILGKNSGIVIGGDFHHNLTPLREGLQYANERGSSFLFNGDWLGDYNIIDVANDLDYMLPIQIHDDFMKKSLSEQDYQAFRVIQEIQSVGGYEQYLGLIAEQYGLDADSLQQLNNQLIGVIEYVQSDLFTKRIDKLNGQFQEVNGSLSLEAQIKLDCLYEVMQIEQGIDFAEAANENPNVSIYFNRGNHDSMDYVDRYIRPHLTNKDQIIVLNDEVGYVETNGINFVGTTNSHQRLISSVSSTLSQPYLMENFSHIIEGIATSMQLSGDVSAEELMSLEETILKDGDFNRMTNNGDDLNKKLHFIATHAPLGSNQIYSAASAYLAKLSGVGVESDTHKFRDDQTSFGSKRLNTGNRLVDMYLEDGDLNYNVLEFDEDFDSFAGWRGYDKDYLKQRVEEMYSLVKDNYLIANNNSAPSSSSDSTDLAA